MANILLTFLLSAGTSLFAGIGHPVFDNGIVVTTISSPDVPAVKAGIKIGDVITKVDNKEILGSEMAIQQFVSNIKYVLMHAGTLINSLYAHTYSLRRRSVC